MSMTSTPLPMMRTTAGTSTLISIRTMKAGKAYLLRPLYTIELFGMTVMPPTLTLLRMTGVM
jgi:hypothetical protein